jgi:acetaldehyde dehydrogenase
VHYGEIVAIGGATRGKAIIALNSAEPPLIMRDTVYCLGKDGDREAIARSVEEMVAEVQTYAPGAETRNAARGTCPPQPLARRRQLDDRRPQ